MDSFAAIEVRAPMILMGIETFLVSAIMAWAATPLAIRLAVALGAVDRPGPRKIHKTPIPRIGGIAIFLGFASGLLFAIFATGYAQLLPVRTAHWGSLAGGAFCILLLGLADDIFGVSFQGKFLVQIGAAFTVWLWGFRIEVLNHPFGSDPFVLGWLSLPITIVWIVGITNAINLIDGLDGLAAGCALITTIAVAVIALHGGRVAVTAISVALVGSLVGFLRYNFNPARIFLGDSGSMFLGFVLAVISIHGSQKGPTAVAVLTPLLVLGFPILDTSLAILRRLYRLGRDGARSDQGLLYVARNLHQVFRPDRAHLHHRLLDLGLSHRAAVLSLYLFMVLLALVTLALVVLKSVVVAGILVVVLALSVAALVLAVLWGRRRREARRIEALRSDADSEFAPVNTRAIQPR